jgi:hypothetical protein
MEAGKHQVPISGSAVGLKRGFNDRVRCFEVRQVRARKLAQLAVVGGRDWKMLNAQRQTSKGACIVTSFAKASACQERLMLRGGSHLSITNASEHSSEMIVCVPGNRHDSARLLDYSVNFMAR